MRKNFHKKINKKLTVITRILTAQLLGTCGISNRDTFKPVRPA